MRVFTPAWERVRSLLFRAREDREMDEELRSHLEMETAKHIEAGLAPREARRHAHLRFGSVERVKDEVRDARGTRALEDLWADLGYAVRTLRRAPTFAATAVVILALGIGANAAVFTIVDAVLFRELPVPDPDRVVRVYTADYSGGLYGGSSYPDFVDYRTRATAFVDLAAYSTFVPMSLGTGGEAERLQGAVVTRNFFEALGIRPALGRFFPVGDDTALGSAPLVVLSHALWRRSFNATAEAIGQEVVLNGSTFTVIGVAPEGFRGVERINAPALWVPMSMLEQAVPRRAGRDDFQQRGTRWLSMVGRLAPGATLTSAQAEVTALAEQLAHAYPATNRGTLQHPDRARPVSMLPASAIAFGPVDAELLSRAALLLMTIVGLVLLIACANVANLLLARATARHREMAVRRALGASRGRVLRQLLTETALLASLGGAAGVVTGAWATRLVPAMVPQELVTLGLELPPFTVDWRVLTFTAVSSLATGLLLGLAPALHITRPHVTVSLRHRARGGVPRSRLRGALVVVQVALSLVLLIGAGLFVRSLQMALATDPGFNSAGVLLADLDLSLQGYDEGRGRRLYAELLERVGSLPGVDAASVAAVVPVNPAGSRANVAVDGYTPQPQEDMELNFNVVSAGYFRVLGMRVVQGRGFSDPGVDSPAGEVVVNETFARRYWPGQNPIDRGIKFGGRPAAWRVVGVVQDGKYRSMREDGLPYLYVPMGLRYTPQVTLLARVGGNPLAMLPAVRAELLELDPALPVYAERSLEHQLASAVFGERLGAMLLGIFGIVALLLATVGVYGVVAYAAQQRTHEIGVRMALGADGPTVVRLLATSGARLVVLGSGIGLAVALLATRVLTGLLFGIEATDPISFVGATLLLGVAALLAAYLPARRATRVDPLTTLRPD